MDKFEEFIRSQGFQGEFQRGCNGQFKSDLLHFMEKAWQSRQAEVEDKDQRIHELNETSLDLEGQIYKLQEQLNEKDKRINQALNFINNWWHPDLDQKLFVEALGRALRGEHE